jgi:hypothetical protein
MIEMAVKDSEELKTDERYPLGDYSFRIERSSVPGSTNDKIEAICTDKDGKNARKSIQVASGTKLFGWYVEANETEATVYAIVSAPLPGGDRPMPIPCAASGQIFYELGGVINSQISYFSSGSGLLTFAPNRVYSAVAASAAPGAVNDFYYADRGPEAVAWRRNLTDTYTYNGKTVYYSIMNTHSILPGTATPTYSGPIDEITAWRMIYGDAEGDEEERIVGRFAIDIEDAGGDGPGSDWIDPGDYDPDWEEGDPTHTLYVTVTGALSGRHNDPIVDPSYSYIPADKDTVKDYGYGGDGGHGGGGGAGASTVVVHKFATNQANSKEVTAIARRHGYGSGGGKGGKGGDGCILVYY